MSLSIQLNEMDTDCDQPIMFTVAWTAVHHMCLSLHVTVGDARPMCDETMRGDGLCMKECDVNFMEPQIMIHAVPHFDMMHMMGSMMNNATLMSTKGPFNLSSVRNFQIVSDHLHDSVFR